MANKINQTVLMSSAQYFDDDQQINPFMTRFEPINVQAAQIEHQQIKEAFEQAGITVVQVDAPAGCQDGVYTANWGLVKNGRAVLSRLPSARKKEEDYARTVLQSLGIETIDLPDGLKFSGQGDSLPCGDYLLCGSQYRSDEAAQEFAASTLGFQRIQLQTIPLTDENGQPVINQFSGWPDSFYYDIDLALAVVKPPSHGTKGLIAWCPPAFTPKSQRILREFDEVDKIEVSETEAKLNMACNLVSTGETIIMNAGAINLANSLKQHGLAVVGLNNPELGKGGGSIRCTSLSLYN